MAGGVESEGRVPGAVADGARRLRRRAFLNADGQEITGRARFMGTSLRPEGRAPGGTAGRLRHRDDAVFAVVAADVQFELVALAAADELPAER